MQVSECCGAMPQGKTHWNNTIKSDMGMCSKCKDHTEFYEEMVSVPPRSEWGKISLEMGKQAADYKETERFLEADQIINKIDYDFKKWMASDDRLESISKDTNMLYILYGMLRSVLRLGLGLYDNNIDKLRKLIYVILSDISDDRKDHTAN